MWLWLIKLALSIWKLSKYRYKAKVFPSHFPVFPKPSWHHWTLTSFFGEKWLNWWVNMKSITSLFCLIFLHFHSGSKLPNESRSLLCSSKPKSPRQHHPTQAMCEGPSRAALPLTERFPNSGPVSRTTWLSYHAAASDLVSIINTPHTHFFVLVLIPLEQGVGKRGWCLSCSFKNLESQSQKGCFQMHM